MSAPKRSRSRSRTLAAPRGRRTGKQNKAFNSSPAKEDFCHRPIARCRWRRSMLDARTTFARNSLSHTGERACTVARPARSSSMLRPYAAAADTDVQNRTLPPRGPRHRNVNNSEHTRCRHTSVAEGICVQPQSGRRSRPFSEQKVLYILTYLGPQGDEEGGDVGRRTTTGSSRAAVGVGESASRQLVARGLRNLHNTRTCKPHKSVSEPRKICPGSGSGFGSGFHSTQQT